MVNGITDSVRICVLERTVVHCIDISCNAEITVALPGLPEFADRCNSCIFDVRDRVTDRSRYSASGKLCRNRLYVILIPGKDCYLRRILPGSEVLFDRIADELNFLRLCGPAIIRLRNGYSASSPSFDVICVLKIGEGKAEWGATPGEKYYVLEILSIE